MLRSNLLPPDDIEDIKAFAEAVHKKIAPEKVQMMLSDFLVTASGCMKMVDEAIYAQASDDDKGLAVGISTLLALYQFIKKNEKSCKALLSLGSEGDAVANIM